MHLKFFVLLDDVILNPAALDFNRFKLFVKLITMTIKGHNNYFNLQFFWIFCPIDDILSISKAMRLSCKRLIAFFVVLILTITKERKINLEKKIDFYTWIYNGCFKYSNCFYVACNSCRC
jgi:hypothetical protein